MKNTSVSVFGGVYALCGIAMFSVGQYPAVIIITGFTAFNLWLQSMWGDYE